MKPELLTLYLVTGRYDFSKEEFLQRVRTACASGITILQLREKDLSTREYYQLALEVKAIADEYQIPLIIDDRVDVCLAVDAAGVHIGDKDMPVDLARKMLGPDKLIGVSIKSVERAAECLEQGADYFGIGAIYHTNTKPTPIMPLDKLTEICASTPLPVVAIGGLTVENLHNLKGTGADGVAVVSEIMLSDNVAEKVKELRKAIQEGIFND